MQTTIEAKPKTDAAKYSLRNILAEALISRGLWQDDGKRKLPFIHNDLMCSTDSSVVYRRLRLRVYANQCESDVYFTPDVSAVLRDLMDKIQVFTLDFQQAFEADAAKVAKRLGVHLESPNKNHTSPWKWAVTDNFVSVTVYVKITKAKK